jgi:hypothetical protein
MVALAKLTPSPLVALATSPTGPSSRRLSDGCAKAIACADGAAGSAAVTSNDLETGAAAA